MLQSSLACVWCCWEGWCEHHAICIYRVFRFNAQDLGEEGVDYQVMVRCVPGVEFVKLILQRGRVVGATLVGDTDLEVAHVVHRCKAATVVVFEFAQCLHLQETMENLILNELDVSAFGDDLLSPDIDLEGYFD